MAESRDIEIRFNVTRSLATLIDALVQSKSLGSRGDLIAPLIEELARKEVHGAIVLLRCAGINPADTEAGRARSD